MEVPCCKPTHTCAKKATSIQGRIFLVASPHYTRETIEENVPETRQKLTTGKNINK